MTKRRTLGKRRRRNTQYARTKNKTKYFRKTRGGMRRSAGYSSLPVRNPPPPPPSPQPLPPSLQMPWSPYTLRRLPGQGRLPVRDPQLIPPPPPSPIPLPIPLPIPSSSIHFKGRDTPWPEL